MILQQKVILSKENYFTIYNYIYFLNKIEFYIIIMINTYLTTQTQIMSHACMNCNLVVLEGEKSCFNCSGTEVCPCTVTKQGEINHIILERHEEGFFCSKCGSYSEGDQCCGFHFREPYPESKVYVTQSGRDEEIEALKRTISQLQQAKDASDEAYRVIVNEKAILQQKLRKTADSLHDTKTELLHHISTSIENSKAILNKHQNF